MWKNILLLALVVILTDSRSTPDYDIFDGRETPTFTESSNYDDEMEKTSLYPIVSIYESSRIDNEENNENITDESVKHTIKDNSTHQPKDVGSKNPLEEKSTFTESTYYGYQTENTVSHPLVTIHTLSRKYTRKNDENTTRDPFENNTQDNSTYNVSGNIPLEEKTTFTQSTNFEDGTEITTVIPLFTRIEAESRDILENSENTTEELFEIKTQDNSTSQANNVSGKIPLEKKPAFTESTNYEEETENTVVSPKFTIYESPSKYNEENITDESFKHSTQDNSTHQPNNISEKIPIEEIPTFGETLVPEEIEIPPSKQLLNQTYKLILKRNCATDALSVFHSLNSILNSELNANNGTKLMKCEQLYEFNVTSNIASPETFDEVINLIKEIMSPDMEVIIVNYDSTLYNTSPTPPTDSESFVVPKFAVYIASGATIAIILFMIFIICVRSKCRGHSTSLDLSDIPHLTLSVDDYKLPPIPRPSVSFPESNRDFLYSYSNETFTKEDDTVLTQRHFSTNGKKDVEMKTFNARRWAQ